MSWFSRALVIFFLGCSSGLAAQSAEVAIGRFVNDHNARVASYDWVKTERGSVTMSVNAANDLEVRLADGLQIVLQRERPDPMDEAFPRSIPNATILLTNATVIVIDEDGGLHFALSLHEEPRLPELTGEPLVLFTGFGLGRQRSGEVGAPRGGRVN